MKIRRYIQGLAIALGLISCNKDIETKKVVNVTIHGYNISDTPLEVSVDTVVFDNTVLQTNAIINFSKVYPYFHGKMEATLRVKNKENGSALFQQTLKLSGSQLEFFYPVVNINGKLLEINPPVADPATNKLGFYIYYPESNDPIDIFMYNPNNGQQFYFAKNVIPQTWVYIDYLPVDGFLKKNDVGSSTVYFTKAGTIDQWAFGNNEYLSQTSGFGLYLPHEGYNLNKVQPYFIYPPPNGWQPDVVRLFPNPKVY